MIELNLLGAELEFSHRFQEPYDEALFRLRLTLLSYESQFNFCHYLFSQTLSNGAGL